MKVYDSKVAIVTGGCSGIGAACARMLADKGAHVVVTSHLSIDEMQPVCDEIHGSGGTATAITADVTDEKAVKLLVQDVAAIHGRIDMLVNGAGLFDITPLFESDVSRIRKMVEINFLGSVTMLNHVLPVMRAQKRGAVVNIASGSAILGQGGYAGYAASKAAIAHFTRTIAPELAHSGIRVNAVAPGAVRTAMTAMVHTPQSAEMVAAYERIKATTSSPYGTAFMEPEDIAEVILFLLSDAARAIQGACIVADQGFSAALPTL